MRKEIKIFSVTVDKEVYDKLNEICDSSGQSKTKAVQRALAMYFKSYEQEQQILSMHRKNC